MAEMSSKRRLLLLGAGHSHAQVLKDLAERPLRDVEAVLVAPARLSPYSGMVPGWLAGLYRFDEICIDFASLADAAAVAFCAGEVGRLDADRQTATLTGGETIAYDVLSINVGSTLVPPASPASHAFDRATVLAMRPISALHRRWIETLESIAARRDDRPLTVAAIGGGAAGVESLLAALTRLRTLLPGRDVRGSLVTTSSTLLPGLAPSARRRAQRALLHAGVSIRLDTPYEDALARSSDLLLWATGAQAHPWQSTSGLAVSGAGFIRVDPCLRSLSHRNVFAAGDCVDWPAGPLPKAGVFAVRMGPVLSRNLRAMLGSGAGTEPYRPQRRFLALLSTADGKAIASWGSWSAEGRWVWHWKDRIDRSFVGRFSTPTEPAFSH